MIHFWLVWRYLRSGRKFLGLTTMFSVVGMTLGVASLVVAMAVVSGYETTLKESVIDVFGHILVSKGGEGITNRSEFETKIKEVLVDYQAMTPFVSIEGVLAKNKKISGVMVQGVEPETMDKVLNLRSRLVDGQFDLSTSPIPKALVGKRIAKKFALKIGDTFRVVKPESGNYDAESFRPRLQKFQLSGVLDLGREDFDSRTIVTDVKIAQEFAGMGDRYSGMRIKMVSAEAALAANDSLREAFAYPYWTRDWYEVNKNLFQAVSYERVIIFIVILIMVMAACFNISSTLFVSVMRRYGDISIFKTMGANRQFVRKMFTRQGLVIGFIGTACGFLVGILACLAFVWAQKYWGLIPGEIYKLDKIKIELRGLDLASILLASLLICFLSTLAPARRGAKLTPVEGLRYE